MAVNITGTKIANKVYIYYEKKKSKSKRLHIFRHKGDRKRDKRDNR